jgi:hypothetical protein
LEPFVLLELLLAVNLQGRWMTFGPQGQIVGEVEVAAGSERRVFAVGERPPINALFKSEDGGAATAVGAGGISSCLSLPERERSR